MKKNKKENPIAYDIDYDEYETIEYENNEKEESDTEISDLESDISDKNDQEVILKEVEEMNNNYSFLNIKPKKKKDTNISKESENTELQEEPYLSD